MRFITLVTTFLLFAVLLSGCALRRLIPRIKARIDRVALYIERVEELADAVGGKWGRECLPDHLKDKLHNDWPWPLNKIHRSTSAFCGGGEPDWPPEIPMEARKAIPPPGMVTYHHRDQAGNWRPYYALTTKDCLHMRNGFRWDDVDGYFNLVIPWMATVKRVPGCESNPDGNVSGALRN